MFNKRKKTNLSDLIDVEFLQKLQDNFATTMGVASLTVDDDGPITKPSNFTDFCTNFIRTNELGSQKCNECDIEGGKLAVQKGEPIIYTCHTGLTHFVVPIMVAGKHIASILGGQISLKKPDEQHFKNIAKELGITDEENYIKDLRKIKVISEEHLKSATQLLFLVANSISEIANKNFELLEKNKKENLYRTIVETMRSSLDIDTVKHEIVFQIGSLLEADRVAFADYDSKKGNYFIDPKNEYRSSSKVKTFVGYDFAATPGFIEAIRELHLTGKDIIFDDLDEYLEINNLKNTGIEHFYREMGFLSSMAINLCHGDEFYGNLVITFEEKRDISENDIKFIRILADQAGIALYQAELYKKEKKTAERETILRDITGKMRSSLNIEHIQHEIVNQIGKFLNADGVRIADYNYETADYTVSKKAEYRSSHTIKSLVGVIFKNISGFTKYIRDVHMQGEDIIFSDLEKYLDEKQIRGTGVEKFYREFGFNSSAAINIYYGDMYLGDFVITFENKRDFSDDEIKFLRALADQAGTAFYQAQMYKKEKLTAEQERILRDIITKIRSSLNLEAIKHEIVTQIGILFKANRVAMGYYDYNLKMHVVTKDAEYKSSNNVKTYVGVDFNSIQGFVEYIRNVNLHGDDIIFGDLEKHLDEYNLRGTGVEKFYNDFGNVSSVSLNINYGDMFLGNLVITFEHKREFSDNELKFLRTIADQAGVAFHQAELYKKERQTAEKEITLRETIKILRSTLNLEEIKKRFVEITGDYFNADRCLFDDYDKETNKFLPFRIEKLKSTEIQSLVGISVETAFPEFAAKLKKGKNVVIKNLEKTLSRKKLLGYKAVKTLQASDVKSDYGLVVKYKDQIMGILILHFVNQKRILTHDEFDFLKVLRDQAGTALYQAELYEKTKENAERENSLRTILETMRSSLDINVIKNTIVTEIGKALNLDICFIMLHDPVNDYFYVDKYSEYLSSPKEKSFVGANSEDPKFKCFMDSFKKNQDVSFSNSEEFIIQNNLQGSSEEGFLKEYNIKSSYSISTYYADNLLGYIHLMSTQDYRELKEEEFEFFRIIATQAGIALYQARLYKITQMQAEREALLRTITETIRGTLDIDETKKTIVEIIGKTLNADRCYIVEYDKKSDKFLIINDEYLSSDEILGYRGLNVNKELPHFVEVIKKGESLLINDKEIFLNTDNQDFHAEKKIIEKYKINSAYTFPLYYHDELLGTLSIHYVKEKHFIDDDEINFIKLIANQVAIAIYQAKLYQKIQLQAERERISRNIIEILRSTLDKTIIKYLFVKNIGKYFDADRVFFSEFNTKKNVYLPIDEKSEYLSTPKEKSFMGYDLSSTPIKEHIQPLIDKRELLIPCWNEYIQNNSKSQEFISIYEDANIESSYSFPVLYEGTIMGYFCIEFTHKICELLDEDIKRIRSICTQAGIALHHAELYMKAQAALQSKERIIEKVKCGIKEPVDNIIKTSKVLSELVLEHDKQLEYLSNILDSCNQLMELTRDISEFDD